MNGLGNEPTKMTEMETKEFVDRVRAFTNEEWDIISKMMPPEFVLGRLHNDQIKMNKLKQQLNNIYGCLSNKTEGGY